MDSHSGIDNNFDKMSLIFKSQTLQNKDIINKLIDEGGHKKKRSKSKSKRKEMEDDTLINFKPLVLCKPKNHQDTTKISIPDEDEFRKQCQVKFFDIQIGAVRWMYWIEQNKKSEKHVGGILGDVMGLGKTIDALGLTSYDYFDPEIPQLYTRIPEFGTLVITTLTLIHQWKLDLLMKFKFPKKYVIIYHGAKRYEEYEKICETGIVPKIFITNYQTVQKDFTNPESPLFKLYWRRVLLDEAHIARNSNTNIYSSLLALKAHAKWCITGTPIVNYPDDIRKLSQLCTPGFTLNYGNSLRESRWKSKFLLRRTKDMLVLPSIIHKDIWLDFISESEKENYLVLEQWAQTVYNELASVLNQKYQKILLVLIRLRQACDHLLLQRKTSQGVSLTSKMLEVIKQHYGIQDIFSKKKLNQVIENSFLYMSDACTEDHHTSSDKDNCISNIESLLDDIEENTEGLLDEYISSDIEDEIIKKDLLGDFEKDCEYTNDDTFQNNKKRSLQDFNCHQKLETELITEKENIIDTGINTDTRINTDIGIIIGTEKIDIGNDVTDTTPKNNCVSEMEETFWKKYEKEIDLDDIKSIENASDNSVKVNYTKNYVKSVLKTNPESKFTIFTQFTTMLDIIEIIFIKENIKVLRFDGRIQKSEMREKIIDIFNTDPEYSVIIVSLKAGGVGLNLVAADHLILIDPWWNSSVELQAFDRVHRIGQTKPVTILRLLIRGCIEEEVLKIQEKKNSQENTFYHTDSKKILSIKDIHCVFNTMVKKLFFFLQHLTLFSFLYSHREPDN